MVFTKRQKLETRSLCDSDCIYTAIVIDRTDKTVLIEMDGKDKRCKIHLDRDGVEFIYPLGRYSMAPTFRAEQIR